MNLERLTEMVLERRFGTPSAEDAATLAAWTAADAAARAEVERLERLLDAAPDAGVDTGVDFAARLAARLEASEGAFRKRRFARYFKQAVAAYSGVAAGALVYLMIQSAGDDHRQENLRQDAALDTALSLKDQSSSRPKDR